MALFRPTYTDKKTGERKAAEIWWYDFIFDGKRIRESAKTTKKTIAAAAEKDHRRRLERARAGLASERPQQRIKRVAEALAEYRRDYGVNHRPRSVEIVRDRGKHLNRLLGQVLLPDLTQARLVQYIEQRRSEPDSSNRTINMELLVLSRAVGFTWKTMWPKLKKLEENRDVGRALDPEEEKRILCAAAASRSKLIYPFLMVLAWTGMRSDEARMLRWSQVNFEADEIRVGKAKTDAGSRRAIPMGWELRAALEQHAALCARQLGPIQPDWYLFPLSDRIRLVDAMKPVTSLKTAWESVRTKATVECRLHDFRHSFCTKLAEAGVPESTMLDMMGHVSASMLRRYSHIRAKARREAISAIENRSPVLQEVPKVAKRAARKPRLTN